MTCNFRDEFEQLRDDFIVEVTDGNIAIYSSVFGRKIDLVIELNDDRIKKSELDTIVASGGFGGSGNMHIRGVSTNNDPQFCIDIESSPVECNKYRTGDKIHLFHNNIEKATIPKKFDDFSFCLPLNNVDIANDQIKLHIKGTDGVSDHKNLHYS